MQITGFGIYSIDNHTHITGPMVKLTAKMEIKVVENW